MIPKRYSILLADRTSGAVRRFTVAVRPTLAVVITLLACVTALGLHARWTTIAEIEGLRMRNATLDVENTSYRKAADTLGDQMVLLEAAMTNLGTRSELDPTSQEAIDRLPSRVRVRAIGESLLPGLPPPRAPLPTELSPKYTLALVQDLLGNLEGRLQSVRYAVARREALADATPSIWPARGWLSASYGYRRDPFTGQRAFHSAVDISTREGQPIYATAAGRVASASRSGAYGNLVVIEHGFRLTTRYGHLLRFAVRSGDTVRRGDVVGYVGETGRATGTHVHYEVWADGRPMNPRQLLPARHQAAN